MIGVIWNNNRLYEKTGEKLKKRSKRFEIYKKNQQEKKKMFWWKTKAKQN